MDRFAPVSGNGVVVPGADPALEQWLVPYAERLFARFPDVLRVLGDPNLPKAYDVSAGAQNAQIEHSLDRTVVKVALRPYADGAHYFSSQWPSEALHMQPPVIGNPYDRRLYPSPPLDPTWMTGGSFSPMDPAATYFGGGGLCQEPALGSSYPAAADVPHNGGTSFQSADIPSSVARVSSQIDRLLNSLQGPGRSAGGDLISDAKIYSPDMEAPVQQHSAVFAASQPLTPPSALLERRERQQQPAASAAAAAATAVPVASPPKKAGWAKAIMTSALEGSGAWNAPEAAEHSADDAGGQPTTSVSPARATLARGTPAFVFSARPEDRKVVRSARSGEKEATEDGGFSPGSEGDLSMDTSVSSMELPQAWKSPCVAKDKPRRCHTSSPACGPDTGTQNDNSPESDSVDQRPHSPESDSVDQRPLERKPGRRRSNPNPVSFSKIVTWAGSDQEDNTSDDARREDLVCHVRSTSSVSNAPSSPSHSVMSSPSRSTKNTLMNRRGMSLSLNLAVTGEQNGNDKEKEQVFSPNVIVVEEESVGDSDTGTRLGSKGKMRIDPKKFLSGGALCRSPEQNQRAAQPMSLLSSRRFLPGAFPTRRTVIFFDWDDTLCPTTWIRSMLKAHMADSQLWAPPMTQNPADRDYFHSIPGWFAQPLPDEPHVHAMIEDCQAAAINMINLAQSYGIVCIVTNAVHGWVRRTINKWLPKLKQYVFGHGARPEIRVIYGQQAYENPPASLADLPWVDECGPFAWWKISAMTMALDEVEKLYRRDDLSAFGSTSDFSDEEGVSWCDIDGTKRITNVVSIGDNDAEMQAVEIVAIAHEHRRIARVAEELASTVEMPTLMSKSSRFTFLGSPEASLNSSFESCSEQGCVKRLHHDGVLGASAAPLSHGPWVKRIKLAVCPHIRQLITQLEEMVELLPPAVALRRHFQVSLERPEDEAGFDPEGECEVKPRGRSELSSKILCLAGEDLALERKLCIQTV